MSPPVTLRTVLAWAAPGAVAAAALVGVSGCSADPTVVPATTVVRQVAPVVADRTGTEPDDVTCGELELTLGERSHCTVRIGRQELRYDAVVARLGPDDDYDLDVVQL